jgi:starch phosphorylase
MWQPLFPNRDADSVPITHVTNGVHLPTWMAPAFRLLFERHFGKGWEARAADAQTWAGLDAVPDEELWAIRQQLRAELVEYVRQRTTRDRLARGDSLTYVEAAARCFDPGVLTIVFARRLATYKRLHLLSHDPSRVLALLLGTHPIQVLIAGKAHPRDDEAKRVVQTELFPCAANRRSASVSLTSKTTILRWRSRSCEALTCGSICPGHPSKQAARAA